MAAAMRAWTEVEEGDVEDENKAIKAELKMEWKKRSFRRREKKIPVPQ